MAILRVIHVHDLPEQLLIWDLKKRGINLRALAEKMGQCSGAEVRGIYTEASMYALRERRQHVTQEDFEFEVVYWILC